MLGRGLKNSEITELFLSEVWHELVWLSALGKPVMAHDPAVIDAEIVGADAIECWLYGGFAERIRPKINLSPKVRQEVAKLQKGVIRGTIRLPSSPA